jgi:hypothetical protein
VTLVSAASRRLTRVGFEGSERRLGVEVKSMLLRGRKLREVFLLGLVVGDMVGGAWDGMGGVVGCRLWAAG